MRTLPSVIISLLSLVLVAEAVTPRDNEIRFAWFTDTHIGTQTGADDLRIVTSDARDVTQPDFVLVSGDVSEMDIHDNLDLAKTILDSMAIPYYIIPGNHDTKWSDSGAGRFTQLWGDDRFNFEVGEFRFIGIHQGPLMRMGDGYIDPDDIAWVDSILQALPDPSQKIFLVQHYPLDPAVDNWYALRDIIHPFNMQAILHGHGHRNRVSDYEGIPGIMSRSTLRRGEQPTGYTLATLNADSARFEERIPLADSLFQWHSMALGRRDHSGSEQRPYPDFSWNDSSGVELLWQVETGAIITSAAALSKDRVVVANTKGQVIALEQSTGKRLWVSHVEGAIHSTPAIQGKQIIVGSTDSTIRSLDLRTGKLRWETTTTDPVLGSALISKGRVYIGSGDGIMRALKLRNGKLIWENNNPDGFIESTPALAGNQIIFGAWDEYLYALDRNTGLESWRWSRGKPGVLYSPAACVPVVSGNKVFVVAPDRVMSAIDLKTGQTIWRKSGHQVRESIGISKDGSQIYARTMNDSCLAVDATADSFKLNWIRHIGFGYDFAPNAMPEADGQVFFSTKDGWVYCLSGKTGDLQWKYRISDGLVNRITPISGDEVICTAADGKISYLKFSDKPISERP